MAGRKKKKPKAVAPRVTAPLFAKWIDETGAAKIAEKLSVTRFAVNSWRLYARGLVGGYRPDPSRLGEIIRLSAGALTSADIYPEQK